MKKRDNGKINTEESEVLDKEIQILFTFWSFSLDDPELDLSQSDFRKEVVRFTLKKIKSEYLLICNILEILLLNPIRTGGCFPPPPLEVFCQ